MTRADEIGALKAVLAHVDSAVNNDTSAFEVTDTMRVEDGKVMCWRLSPKEADDA